MQAYSWLKDLPHRVSVCEQVEFEITDERVKNIEFANIGQRDNPFRIVKNFCSGKVINVLLLCVFLTHAHTIKKLVSVVLK